MSEPHIDLKIGHVLDVLREMPEQSVHCCVTSPPYWGLREYGTKPQAWGGDSACKHKWGEWQEHHETRETTKHGKTRTTDRYYGSPSRRFDESHHRHVAGTFCKRCGAWKGEHGHEPTPELWVEHEVMIYREVGRVLRDDGTLWVVVGDCYSSKGSHGGNDPKSKARRNRNREDCGRKPKDRVTLGWDLFKALQRDGWYGRQPIVWAKGVSFLEAWAGAVFPDSVNGTRWERHRIRVEKSNRAKPNSYHTKSQKGTNRPHAERDGPKFADQSNKYVECPGCPKCEPNDGLVLRRGAWRPTSSYELVLMMSKRPVYYADKYAVTESCSRRTHSRGKGVCPKSAEPGLGVKANSSFYEATKGPVSSRNLRSVWCVPVKPTKLRHFAVFPPDLVRPVIRAATSEAGACPACGAPWARVVNVGRTLGWRPTCGCGAGDPAPAVVLDPFCGSGTTLQVCLEEGRAGVGIDLDEASRKHLETRLAEARERVRVRDAMRERVPADEPGQLTLEECSRGEKRRGK